MKKNEKKNKGKTKEKKREREMLSFHCWLNLTSESAEVSQVVKINEETGRDGGKHIEERLIFLGSAKM